MTARLDARFAALKREGRAGFVAYLMAGDPDLETSWELLRRLPDAGADVIELGFPFSDPMADGPVIQAAGRRALGSGTTLARTLELAARFRAEHADTPLILMGYANPVHAMGYAPFAARMAEASADGAIIVDLPPEEDEPLRTAFAAQTLSLVRLAAPTTDETRLARVLENATGFLYYVSVTGVTGAGVGAAQAVQTDLERIRKKTDLPVAVGFGVRAREQASAFARVSDAVVVGSAIVDALAGHGVDGALKTVAELSEAVRGARAGAVT